MFGKARIQRFNEIKAKVSSSTSYNVKNKNKAFLETKSKEKSSTLPQTDGVSDKSSSVSDIGSTRSTPCFRTPSIIKHKKLTSAAPTSKLNSKEVPKEIVDIETLREKIVECENKDAYIKELSEQLEEIKEKLYHLEKTKEVLDSDKRMFDEMVEDMRKKHKNDLDCLSNKFNLQISELNTEKQKLIDEISQKTLAFEELNDVYQKNRTKCCDVEEVLERTEEKHNQYLKEKEIELENKEKELKALEINCMEIQRKHCDEIQNLKKEHNLEIQDMEFEMLKCMTEVQREKENTMFKVVEVEQKMKKAISELQESFLIEKQQIISAAEDKVEQVKKSMIATIPEDKIQEETAKIIKIWREKLDAQEKESQAILRECQAISEYNIIQCEIEKNNIKQCLVEKSKELEELQSKYNNILHSYDELNLKYKELQQEMSRIILELNDTKKTLHEELAKKNKALEQFNKEKTTYEVTIKNSQVTIDVLKKRLIHSDKDVEQLKSELAENEGKMLEYEQKYLQLTAELKSSQNYNDELEMTYESDMKLNRSDIEKLRELLYQKVDQYKQVGEKYNKELQETKLLKDEIFGQLQNAFSVVNKLKMELDCLETINSQYEFEIEQSQNELEDYHMREMDWNIVKDKLEDTVVQMEKLLEERQTELDSLKKQVLQLQEKNDLQSQYTDYYENKIKEYEKELQDTGNIHKKYIEMSGKYDELSQKFEQLELENIESKKKITNLTAELVKKADMNQKCKDQQLAYDQLLSDYESLQKGMKQEADEMGSFVETLSDKDSLQCKIYYLENELKDVSQKYADLVGHHNNKQKRKHMIELKTKNDELIQGNMDLELKLRNHVKMIEKLKKENADLKKCLKKPKFNSEDKENFGSPNRSLNSSRIESPLRERN